MSNIMINEVCNLKCKYCFARPFLNEPDSRDITTENFEKIVDFILTRRGARIGLIGGEPTLHPKFDTLLSIAREKINEAKSPSKIVVFSNGIILDKWADKIAKANASVLINLNSPKDIGETLYEKTIQSIKYARLHGVKIKLGINFYDPSMDTSFLEDLLKELSMDALRVGLPAPNNEEKRSLGPLYSINSLKEGLFTFFDRLNSIGVHPRFDCQKIPFCLLSDEEIKLLKSYEKEKGDLVFEANCHPVIDFKQDMTCIRCFGMADHFESIPISNFRCYDDAVSYFRTNIDDIARHVPVCYECTSCYYKQTSHCNGGCISYKAESVKEIKEKIDSIFV